MPPRSRRMDSQVDLFVSRMPAGLAKSISSAAPGTSGETSSCAMSQVNVRWRRAVVVIGIHCDTPEPSGSARRPQSLRTDTAPYSGWHASCSAATAARRASASGEREERPRRPPCRWRTSRRTPARRRRRAGAATRRRPSRRSPSSRGRRRLRDRGVTGSEGRGVSARARGSGSARAGGGVRDGGEAARARARRRARRGRDARSPSRPPRAPPTFSVVVRRLKSRRWPHFFVGGGGATPARGGRGSRPVAARTHRFLLPLLGETALAFPRQRRVARREVCSEPRRQLTHEYKKRSFQPAAEKFANRRTSDRERRIFSSTSNPLTSNSRAPTVPGARTSSRRFNSSRLYSHAHPPHYGVYRFFFLAPARVPLVHPPVAPDPRQRLGRIRRVFRRPPHRREEQRHHERHHEHGRQSKHRVRIRDEFPRGLRECHVDRRHRPAPQVSTRARRIPPGDGVEQLGSVMLDGSATHRAEVVVHRSRSARGFVPGEVVDGPRDVAEPRDSSSVSREGVAGDTRARTSSTYLALRW